MHLLNKTQNRPTLASIGARFPLAFGSHDRHASLPSRQAAGLSGEIISAMITGVEPTGTDLKSSCADLIRASTSLFRALEGVDGRDKPGQDEISGSICSVIRPQDFPRTALRFCGND